jgi:hypothetical protein
MEKYPTLIEAVIEFKRNIVSVKTELLTNCDELSYYKEDAAFHCKTSVAEGFKVHYCQGDDFYYCLRDNQSSKKTSFTNFSV